MSGLIPQAGPKFCQRNGPVPLAAKIACYSSFEVDPAPVFPLGRGTNLTRMTPKFGNPIDEFFATLPAQHHPRGNSCPHAEQLPERLGGAARSAPEHLPLRQLHAHECRAALVRPAGGSLLWLPP